MTLGETSPTITRAMETKFYLGDYEGCIEEAKKASESPTSHSLWFRSLVHLNRIEEARKLSSRSPSSMNGDKLLRSSLLLYAETFPRRQEVGKHGSVSVAAIEAIEQQLTEDNSEEINQAKVILSIIASWVPDLTLAYRLAAQSPVLEAQCLLVTYLVKINRYDLVERKLEKLRKRFLDTILFQLTEAQVALSKGGMAIKDALYIYQELIELHGRTIKLMNWQTTCLLLLNRTSEAEATILDVLQMDPMNSMALSHLINLSVMRDAGVHLINDQLARLAAADKTAPFLQMLEQYAQEFERTRSKLT